MIINIPTHVGILTKKVPETKPEIKLEIKQEQEIKEKMEELQNLNNSPISHYAKIDVKKVTPIKEVSFPRHALSNYKGCLVGGSIGDALGWPVEFLGLYDIKNEYGEKGITYIPTGRSGKAEITDDTQMTIFTADGLIKSAMEGFDENSIPNMNKVYSSYQRWLETQYSYLEDKKDGWISHIPELHASRAPGTTCTGALRRGIPGSIENPINNSKGCGGVMRVAPVGLMYYKNAELAFEVGARCAALTHGSPSAYLPAGVHASIIANLVQGKGIEEAIDNAIEILKKYDGNEDTLELIELAKEYAKSDIDSETAIKNLGEGWHGDEAIAISLYCVLKSPEDFEKALFMAVNHDGDSDSTGAIVGNILGTYLGEDKIPSKWKNIVELNKELNQLATDLYNKPNDIEEKEKRYPTL